MHWRHIEIRNPLRPRTPTFFESLLAKEKEEKEGLEKETRRVERARRKSLARIENREAIWPRMKRFFRRLGRKKVEDFLIKGISAAAERQTNEHESPGFPAQDSNVAEDGEETQGPWEGDWSAVLEESEEE
jgi:hypothetical protein